nr:hypothetical protein [Tanacetum cinerariifolium]
MTIDQQVALDEDLVPDASRLRIRKSNFRLRSNITSKESTLQLATAIVHHHSIRFKMDNMKRIIDLEYFREMMHICPRLVGQTFDDLSFEEEILDFVYQVEHKDAKKRNEMYYPRFIKVIIYYFMTKDPSIPRRNVVNWHYVRDDKMFTTIKLVSRHQNTQQFGVMLPIELTNENIRNSEAYKEYYVVASGAAPPKTKASVRKTKSSYDTIITPPTAAGTKLSNTTITPPTAAGTRLSTSAKGIQPAKASKAKKVSPCSLSGSGADEGSGNDDANLGLNVGGEEGQDAEDDEDELYRDVNINLEGRDMDVPASTTVASISLSAPTLTPPTIPTISTVPQAPTPPTTNLSTLLQDLLNCGSLFGFDHQLKTLEANFFEIIKEQVKDQVKVQVSKILPKIEKTMNEQLEAEVLIRSSNSSKTSYAVAADLSEMELKKILIEKMENNKSIYRSDEQMNLYKALVEAYKSDKIILDTYRDIVTLKRRRDDDADKDEEPFAGSDRG